MTLNRNVLRIISLVESENDVITNADDEMTNNRMGRDVQKYFHSKKRSSWWKSQIEILIGSSLMQE